MRTLSIQITNSCNLSCPSCCVGRVNFKNRSRTTSMAPGTLDAILKKINEYIPDAPKTIAFHNYNEPLLHHDLGAMIEVVAKNGMTCFTSSNLNVQADFAGIVNSPVFTRLVVSVSGYEQEIYQRGHRGGNIRQVLKNLDEIAKVKKNDNCRILIAFHQYNDNRDDEAKMKKFALDRGFEFYPYPAILTKGEWIFQALLEESAPWFANEDVASQVLPRLLLPETCVEIKRHTSLFSIDCTQQSDELFVDTDGSVQTCCWMARSGKENMGNIISDHMRDLIHNKHNNALCRLCKKNGFHITTYITPFLENYLTLPRSEADHQHNAFLLRQLHNLLADEGGTAGKNNSPAIVLYGAGGLGTFLATLLLQKGYQVNCLIDDNAAAYERQYKGLEILTLDQAITENKLNNAFIMIAFDNTHEQKININNRLQKSGNYKAHTFDVFLEQVVPSGAYDQPSRQACPTIQ